MNRRPQESYPCHGRSLTCLGPHLWIISLASSKRMPLKRGDGGPASTGSKQHQVCQRGEEEQVGGEPPSVIRLFSASESSESWDRPQKKYELDNYRLFQCYKENKQGHVMESSRRPAKIQQQQLLSTDLCGRLHVKHLLHIPDSTQSA